MKNFILPLLLLLGFSNHIFAQCDVEVYLDKDNPSEVTQSGTICLDVRVNNFNGVAAFQLALRLDSSIFDVADVAVANNSEFEITPGDYSLRDSVFRVVVFNGSGDAYSNLADSSLLFQLCLRPRSGVQPQTKPIFILEDEGEFSTIDSRCLNVVDEGHQPITITSVIQSEYTINAASCQSNNGSFSVDINGGDAPYQVTWTGIDFVANGTANYTVAGGVQEMGVDLETGFYQVEINDSNTPPNNRIDTIEIENAENIELEFEETKPCGDDDNGSLQVRLLANGVERDLNNPIYTINWSNGETTPLIEDLSPGSYTVTVNDQGEGCLISQTIVFTSADVNFNPTISNEPCQNNSVGQGSILLNPSNGNAPYTVSWGHTEETAFFVQDLGVGSYPVTITDNSQCAFDTVINIIKPTPPTIQDVTIRQPTCNTPGNGLIRVVLEKGTGEFGSFLWKNSILNTTFSSDLDSLTGIGAGTFSWEMLTEDGCKVEGSEEISAINQFSIDNVTVKDESCPTGSGSLMADGGITVDLAGGSSPFTFRWSDAPNAISTQNNRTDLAEGSYTVTVTDNTGCQIISDPITVQNPAALDIQFSNVVSATCPQSSVDGQVTALVAGGTPDLEGYFFEWSSGETGIGSTHRAIGLPKGANSVTVTDANFCQSEAQVIIDAPEDLKLVLDENILTETSCAGTSDGRIRVFPQGGTAPYTITWDHGDSGDDIGGLPPGNYRYTLQDANNCLFSSSIQITAPEPLSIQYEASTSTDITCAGENDGSIEVTPIGGTPEYTYQWSAGVPAGSQATARPLAPGTYSLTLTDKNNCRATLSNLLVRDKTPIRFDIPTLDPIVCAGAPTSLFVQNVSGGNGNSYKLVVNDVLSVNATNGSIPLIAGQYTVAVEDEVFGCSSDTVIQIEEPSALLVELGSDREIIVGDTISLAPDIANGTDSLSYSWQSSRADSFCTTCPVIEISPTRKTNYSLLVVDQNGCEATADITIDVDRKRRVNFPNIFSPNGSGRNISFGPIINLSSNAIRNFGYFRIFDRWGNQLYEATDIEPSVIDTYYWDGKFNGSIMPTGVYIYLVEVTFADNQTFLYRGHVTLMR